MPHLELDNKSEKILAVAFPWMFYICLGFNHPTQWSFAVNQTQNHPFKIVHTTTLFKGICFNVNIVYHIVTES